MKKKMLRHVNTVLGLAILSLMGTMSGCMVKYGVPPDPPEKRDTMPDIVPLYGIQAPVLDIVPGDEVSTDNTSLNGEEV